MLCLQLQLILQALLTVIMTFHHSLLIDPNLCTIVLIYALLPVFQLLMRVKR